ncbi:hypothetical protein LTR10_012531 [Elasticomyces elasticus]|nr:hypothetical protein LTR10_012531 [Elasticomyces elasticus]KAK4966005.1 hypothetical protein LTR42_012019 [Elasticomyces elasticus]
MSLVQSKLCGVCQTLNISAGDFIVKDEDNTDKYEQYYDLGALHELRKRAETCPLCWLYLDAAGNPPVTAPEDNACQFSWANDGFVDWSEAPLVRCLRLRIQPWLANWPEFNKITLLLDQASEEYDLFLGRRRSGGRWKASLARKWMRDCERWHGDACDSLLTDKDAVMPVNFRLVDCLERRLVVAPINAKYLALSYVWGRAKIFQLNTTNRGALERLGGLKTVWDELPLTIRDTIRVTSKLGYRYVWIDSLCIVQDDDADKKALIPLMDLIYNRALLSIVAGSGDTAGAGLPGVSATSKIPQAIREVSSGCTLLSQKHLVDLLEYSFYESRGWTYQERCLSRRRLYFFDEQTVFECRRSVWREDAVLEDPDVVSSFDTSSIHSISGIVRSGLPYEQYGGSVYWYSQRNLTSNSDVLNAFAGISRVLLRGMGELYSKAVSSIYGLPSSMFDWAILWSPNKTAHRRTGGWPSWSWCGWVGGVGMALTGVTEPQLKEWLQHRTRVRWRTYAVNGWPCECIDSLGQASVNLQFLPTPSPQQVLELEEAYLAKSGLVGIRITAPLSEEGDTLLPILQLRAQVARFELQPVDGFPSATNAVVDRGYHISLAGVALGGIWLDMAWQHDTEVAYEFVVLSEARMSSLREQFLSRIKHDVKGEWDGYHVMLVKSVCEGHLRERVAIGTILQSAVNDQSGWDDIWLR